MNRRVNNYARHTLSGAYVFFDGAHAPSFSRPWEWAFYRRPASVPAEDFVGQLVGVNPAGVPDSDPETPASAPPS